MVESIFKIREEYGSEADVELIQELRLGNENKKMTIDDCLQQLVSLRDSTEENKT